METKDSENSKPTIFISFSGQRSKDVAEELAKMLRIVFHRKIEIFKSPDIGSGKSITTEMREQLRKSNYGILCITKENQINPWLIFEAGALSKNFKSGTQSKNLRASTQSKNNEAYVVPYLIGDIKISALSPLQALEFKPRKANKNETLTLIRDISKVFHVPLGPGFKARFNRRWEELSKSLSRVSKPEAKLTPISLPELHEQSWLMEQGYDQDFHGRDFHRWLRNQILDHATEAISEETESKSWSRGLKKYTETISNYLKQHSPNSTMTVLALCGEKGFTMMAGIKYFNMFYDFAINQARKTRDNRIRVCRVFVKQKDPKHAMAKRLMERVIKGHREHEKYGVMALTINKKERASINIEYPGIANRLDAEFGFVIFHTPRWVIAITHEGRKQDFAFSELNAPLNLLAILDLFRGLCEASTEFNSKKHKQELQKLFIRIQPNKTLFSQKK